MQKNNYAKDLLMKGFQKSLDEKQVPLRVHLKIVDALAKSMVAHKADVNLFHVMADRHALQLKEHDEMTVKERKTHAEQLAKYDTEVQRLTGIDHLKGDAGYTPQKGLDYFDAETPDIKDIIGALIPYIPPPKEGKPGKNAVFDKETLIRDIVSYVRKERPFDISHIKGAQEFVMQTGQKNFKVRFEELMHGAGSGGTNTGTAVYNEVVSGSATSWTLANTPTLGTVRLYVNGQRLTPGVGNDYVISGAAITTTLSWATGTILADYIHA